MNVEEIINKAPVVARVRAAEEFVRMITLKAIDEAWIEQVDYLQQLRIAISGLLSTPGGAIEIAYLLGREETLRRIDLGLEKLGS